jgi:phytoene desaturase (3,4-didehydrolycopene-forming)
VKNCYFVGASTHPGTGVPIVLAGAKITTAEILRDFGMEIPWGDGVSLAKGRAEVKGEKKGIDTLKRDWMMVGDVGIWVLALLLLAGMLMYGSRRVVVQWRPEGKMEVSK